MGQLHWKRQVGTRIYILFHYLITYVGEKNLTWVSECVNNRKRLDGGLLGFNLQEVRLSINLQQLKMKVVELI